MHSDTGFLYEPTAAPLLERAAYYRALAAKETRATKAAEYRDIARILEHEANAIEGADEKAPAMKAVRRAV